MTHLMFLNLPVENLARSVAFFGELGFTFNPQFTDETSTCMVISDSNFAMLLEHDKFAGFIDKPIAPSTTSEVIIALSCESREQVTTMTQRALDLGARKVNDPEDLGFMFSWGFEDLDGHLWDLFWMDPGHID